MPKTRVNLRTESATNYSDSNFYIQEMIGAPPSWIVRSGTSITALGIILLLFLAWLIRYPDKLTAKAIITSERPPLEITAKIATLIDTLFVSNNQIVAENTLLAAMEDAALVTDVDRLEDFLKRLNQLNSPKAFTAMVAPQGLSLGNLGNAYSIIIQNLQDLRYTFAQTSTQKQNEAIAKEVEHTQKLNQSLHRQEILLQKEIAIVEMDVKRNRQLHALGTISAIDMEEKEKSLIQYQRQLENFPTSTLHNDIRIEQLELQQAQIKQQREEVLTTRLHTLRQQVQSLLSAITAWRQSYLLWSPSTGIVAFSPGIVNKKNVQPGETLFTLLPLNGAGQIIARCEVPIEGIGKISNNTPVQIALDAYPEKEYGILKSTVKDIALVPTTNAKGETATYEIIVLLPDTLRTNYQKVIPFRQNMTATVVIITKDKRILERIFENFLNLIKNR